MFELLKNLIYEEKNMIRTSESGVSQQIDIISL